jgi:hypothetical protein
MRKRTKTDAPTLAPITTACELEMELDGDGGEGVGVGVMVVVDAAERNATVVMGVGVTWFCQLAGLEVTEYRLELDGRVQCCSPENVMMFSPVVQLASVASESLQ